MTTLLSSCAQQTYCNKKENIISNPLVVCIGISKYGNSIPDIQDIHHDIWQYSTVLGDCYNYKVICNKYDAFCSRQTIENYLKETCKKYLINDGKICFNGLIITLSGHCNQHSLLCSDGQFITFHNILSIFTSTWNNKLLFFNLPKFLIIDGNRGFNVCDTYNQSYPFSYSSIISSTSSTNSSAYSGQIAWNFCQIFQQYKNKDLLFYDVIMNLKQRLSQSIYQRDTFTFTTDTDMNMIVFRTNKQNKTVICCTTSIPVDTCASSNNVSLNRTLSAPVRITVKAPSTRAPPIPFTDTSKWNKTFEIITKEYAKTRVKIEWLFIINNEPHNAILTHSQKRKSSVASSRVLWVDGIKIYSNRSRDYLFITKVDGHTLRFKIEHNLKYAQYKYLMSIDKIPHQIAHKQWKLQPMNTNINKEYKTYNKHTKSKSVLTANSKSNWFRNKKKLHVFSPLFNYVPIESDDI